MPKNIIVKLAEHLGNMKLVDVIYDSNLVNSKSEVKGLIKQGAVKIDDNIINDIHYEISNKLNGSSPPT